MVKTIHFLVSGRVQGVFFRMQTRQQAIRLDLTGWVRNLPDGRVEGVASGGEAGLQAFREWLHRGPDLARVTSLEVTEQEYQEFDSYMIR